MFVQERKKPSELLGLEAVLRRLPKGEAEYDYFKKLLIRLKKGFEGELRVDREWDEVFVPSEYYLYHNFEAVNEVGNSHQIDTLFLSPHFIWMFEIKNITGQIDINQSKHQLIRSNIDGSLDSFKNPIDQIERHARFVKRKLDEWNLSLPVETAIIIARNSTIIGLVPPHVSMFHASGIQTELMRLYRKYPKSSLTLKQFEELKVSFRIIYQRKSWKPNINTNILIKGAMCKVCEYKFVMNFENGTFICPACISKSKNALLEALLDYRYVHDEWISNRELREYLGIESRHAAKRIMKNLNLKTEGTKRNWKYYIPENIAEFVH